MLEISVVGPLSTYLFPLPASRFPLTPYPSPLTLSRPSPYPRAPFDPWRPLRPHILDPVEDPLAQDVVLGPLDIAEKGRQLALLVAVDLCGGDAQVDDAVERASQEPSVRGDAGPHLRGQGTVQPAILDVQRSTAVGGPPGRFLQLGRLFVGERHLFPGARLERALDPVPEEGPFGNGGRILPGGGRDDRRGEQDHQCVGPHHPSNERNTRSS